MGETYRQFIDAMVDLARGSVTANRIRANGHAERTNDDVLSRMAGSPPLDAQEFRRQSALLSLTEEQREVVACLLEQERIGAIHDVVANLDAFGVKLEGNSLFDQADEEPKFDFVARLDGEEWYRRGEQDL